MVRLLVAILLLCAGPARAQADPANLMIQVRIEEGEQRAGRDRSDRQSSRQRSSIQQLRVVDGGSASLFAGETRPLRVRQLIYGPDGVLVADGFVLRSLGSSLQLRPRVHGERVSLEITARQERPATRAGLPPGSSELEVLSTQVVGPLGEWLLLGSDSRQEQARDRNGPGYREREGSSSRQIWLRAERLP